MRNLKVALAVACATVAGIGFNALCAATAVGEEAPVSVMFCDNLTDTRSASTTGTASWTLPTGGTGGRPGKTRSGRPNQVELW